MSDDHMRLLRAWIEGALGDDVAISLDPPGADHAGQGVNLYLLELVERPPARGPRRTPLQLGLRYLVTAWSDQREDANRLLIQLAFSAMEEPELEVELAPPPAAMWAALGAPPQPSFLLNVPVRRARPEAPSVPVRFPLRVEPARIVVLGGTVVGPGGVPLAGATVELPEHAATTRTDAQGRFRFGAVPGAPLRTVVRARARGREVSVIVTPDPDSPLVIELDPRDPTDGQPVDS